MFSLVKNIPCRKGIICTSGRSIPTPAVFVNTSHFLPPHLTPDNLRATCKPDDIMLEMYIEDLVENNEFLERCPFDLKNISSLSDYSCALASRDFNYILKETPLTLNDHSIKVNTNSGLLSITFEKILQLVLKFKPDYFIVPSGNSSVCKSKKLVKILPKLQDALVSPTEKCTAFTFVDPIFSAKGLGVIIFKERQLDTCSYEMPVYFRPASSISETIALYKKGVDLFSSLYAQSMTADGSAILIDGTVEKSIDLNQTIFEDDTDILAFDCACIACKGLYSKAYIHHLLHTKEMLARVLLMSHNLYQYVNFVKNLPSLLLYDDKIEEMVYNKC